MEVKGGALGSGSAGGCTRPRVMLLYSLWTESEALYDDYEALKSGKKSEMEIAEEGKGNGTVPTNGKYTYIHVCMVQILITST